MPEVSRVRTVSASRDEVWKLVSDPYFLPRWWPATARVEDASEDGWTSVLKSPGGKTVRADYTRLETEPPRRLSWQQELAESPFERVFSSAVTAVELEPEGEDATRVELVTVERLRGRYRLGSYIVRRAARRRLDEALEGIERAVGTE
jgi:uncharacterized protein YndB with AHSA1/START domain